MKTFNNDFAQEDGFIETTQHFMKNATMLCCPHKTNEKLQACCTVPIKSNTTVLGSSSPPASKTPTHCVVAFETAQRFCTKGLVLWDTTALLTNNANMLCCPNKTIRRLQKPRTRIPRCAVQSEIYMDRTQLENPRIRIPGRPYPFQLNLGRFSALEPGIRAIMKMEKYLKALNSGIVRKSWFVGFSSFSEVSRRVESEIHAFSVSRMLPLAQA